MTSFVLRIGVLVALASGLTACASRSKSSAEPKSEAAYGSAGYPQQPPGAYPSLPTTAPGAPPPPAPSQPGASRPQGEASQPTQSRAQALQSAANEVESSQRELDVAAGDCRNACRALGSMDRAAGRLCGLTQADQTRRCDDAKQRVYSARDRVKATCGLCENGAAVDRSAPIPSLR